MYSNKNIEYINELRIELANSNEYAFGRRIDLFKRLLKKRKFFTLVKIIIRHKKVARLTNTLKQYGPVEKQRGAWKNKRIVVYSCVTGGYDKVAEPIFTKENLEYQLFVDEKNKQIASTKWKIKDLSGAELDNYSDDKKNRYIKFHPHKLFGGKYDYAIYIDGNIQVVSNIEEMVDCVDEKVGIAMHCHRERNDIYDEYKVCKVIRKGNTKKMKMQIDRYRKSGFPKGYGMAEANVIVVDLNSSISKKVMDEWWNEYEKSGSGRDQIAFPFVLWKNDIAMKDIVTLGSNVYANPKLIIKRHVKLEDLI